MRKALVRKKIVRPHSIIGAFLAAVLTLWPTRGASGQESPKVVGRALYALAATPNENISYATNRYPATLYRINSAKKLKVVREITSEKDGSATVQAAGDAIFILDHPHFTVHVIHTNDPTRSDSVAFNVDRRGSMVDLQDGVAAAIAQGAVPQILLPLVIPQGNSPPTITLVSVSSDATQAGSRITFDQWDEYAAIRLEGTPEIPIPALSIKVWIDSGDVIFRSFHNPAHHVIIDTAPPPSLRTGEAGFDLKAINDRYLVLRNLSSGTLVQDRSRNTWQKIPIEGDRSRLRLFGEWLATDVELESSGPFGVDKPEKSGERDSRTNRLPSVYGEYGSYCSYNHRSFPGVLIIQNLVDGRTIRIDTHQEDSEILSVNGTLVLYRVNDSIYQATIAGKQIQGATLIAKDDDVPEVHWIFWSN